jgi:EAL domain-containing protein (putative c-di-GMP-specific phosphodiesterase class I)
MLLMPAAHIDIKRKSFGFPAPSLTLAHRACLCTPPLMPKAAMPLEDLLAYFNHWHGQASEEARHICFAADEAYGVYRGLRLHSVFQALFAADSLQPVAHEALLRARDEQDQAVAPSEAFLRAIGPDDAIYFDRLCRTVHALNFRRQENIVGSIVGDLFLNVSGSHLLSVGGGHGSTFETLLKHCGLQPTQIVLEILESRVDNLQHLQEAIEAYRSRGFRVAIDDFGCQHSNFDRLWQLTPDIVKLDRSLIVQAVSNSRARRILPKLIDIIHDLGAQAVCEGIESADQHQLARDAGADLLQGFYYAKPSPRCCQPIDLALPLDVAA